MPPLAIIFSGVEWSARSIESVLAPRGYAVLRATGNGDVLQKLYAARPDLIILDESIPGGGTAELCHRLRSSQLVSASTPILVTSMAAISSQQRRELIRAGAWDVVGLPMGAEELLLRLDNYVHAKLESNRLREESLLDHLTGLYSVSGLIRRINELGSAAARHHRPLACVALAPTLNGDPETAWEYGEGTTAKLLELAAALRRVLRDSDALGRLSQSEFVVVATDTDQGGAKTLTERLARVASEEKNIRVKAGYSAVPDFAQAAIAPSELLVRATAALRNTQHQGSEHWILPFEENAPSTPTS